MRTTPRARGRRRDSRAVLHGAGTTPACAGTTVWRGSSVRGCWDHPRVRGDNRALCGQDVSDPGPPPRARGRPADRERPGNTGGTTPACAGTTAAQRGSPSRDPDHPRVRGGDAHRPERVTPLEGAPPRARGRRAAQASRDGDRRTTPACAGTTRSSRGARRIAKDYPRVRGDDERRRPPETATDGPPPRARGRPQEGGNACLQRGTTPACAGTTTTSSRSAATPPDHPRVRGDDPWRPGNLSQDQGIFIQLSRPDISHGSEVPLRQRSHRRHVPAELPSSGASATLSRGSVWVSFISGRPLSSGFAEPLDLGVWPSRTAAN